MLSLKQFIHIKKESLKQFIIKTFLRWLLKESGYFPNIIICQTYGTGLIDFGYQ